MRCRNARSTERPCSPHRSRPRPRSCETATRRSRCTRSTWSSTRAYWTMSNEYIESVWSLFRRIWDAGAIYEGYKVVPYCGRCGTALSSHELGQPGAYRVVTEPSIYVRFPLAGRDPQLADADLV